MATSHVIIGDGIAGSSAAETIREADPAADVTVITDEGEALYNRILIKEFAKGKLPEAPISIHDEDWYADRDIELRLNTYVTGVDTEAREVHTHGGEVVDYDRLLVASGGTPGQLPVEDSDAEGIDHFWTFEDARSIRQRAEAADHGVVVGAGLLGIDLAAICAEQGVDAHYLMRGECWWRYALSPDGAEIIHDALRERGVEPVFGSGVDHFETDDDGRVTAAVDPAGERYRADFVGVAIGLNFNTEFLRDTPLELDDGVVVDEYMRTGVDGVYAAGDITQFTDLILGERAQNGAWGSAKQQGSVAGTNMVADAGDRPAVEEEPFRWVSSYSITHFDFPFLSFGHPTLGDDSVERKYDAGTWRRIALKDGRVVGGVLIGDLAPQSALKQLAREQRDVSGDEELLLEESVDVDAIGAVGAEQ